MGVLAQAKNGDKQFWKKNFMQPMGRRSMHSKCLVFFLLDFVLGGGGFFSFFLCSQHVPFKFPMGSQQIPLVPNVFPVTNMV
jgi:hypothetical protein